MRWDFPDSRRCPSGSSWLVLFASFCIQRRKVFLFKLQFFHLIVLLLFPSICRWLFLKGTAFPGVEATIPVAVVFCAIPTMLAYAIMTS